jgi:hypothetical protein
MKTKLFALLSLFILLFSASLLPLQFDSDAQNISHKVQPFVFREFDVDSSDGIDTFSLSEISTYEEVFGKTIDNDFDTVIVCASLTINNNTHEIDVSIDVISGNDSLLSYDFHISKEGIDYDDAWICSGITGSGTKGVLEDVQITWNYIERLNYLMPHIESGFVKEKVEKILAKTIVKRIVSAASAAIPVAGWVVALVSAGLTVYDLIQLANELPEIVELAEIDAAGCIFKKESDVTATIQIAERYGGKNNREEIQLFAVCESTDLSQKNNDEYYIAYVDRNHHCVYVSNYTILMNHAITIMGIPNSVNDSLVGLSVYTFEKNRAKEIAQDAPGSGRIMDNDYDHHHDKNHLGTRVEIGLCHYHHLLHNKPYGAYPSHSFYGLPVVNKNFDENHY